MALEGIFRDTDEYKNGDITVEERMSTVIDGWYISGKPDLIDNVNKVIWDFKTSKNYSKKMVDKDKYIHTYAIQLAVYNMLLGGGYTAKILWFMKDSSAPALEPVVFEQEVPIYSPEQITKIIKDKIHLLETYGDTMPDQCADTWARKVRINGKYTFLKDTKCRFYCSYSTTCEKREYNLLQNISTF